MRDLLRPIRNHLASLLSILAIWVEDYDDLGPEAPFGMRVPTPWNDDHPRWDFDASGLPRRIQEN